MKKRGKSLKENFLIDKSSDKLEKERTLLSNERTMLAYIRTSLAFFAFGIVAIKFFKDVLWVDYLGISSIVFGVVFLLVGVIYYPLKKRFRII